LPVVGAQVEPESESRPETPLPATISGPEDLPGWFNEFVSLEPQAAEEKVQPNELLFRYNFILLPRNSDQFITRPFSELLNQLLPEIHKRMIGNSSASPTVRNIFSGLLPFRSQFRSVW
jgi:hypothetical protein